MHVKHANGAVLVVLVLVFGCRGEYLMFGGRWGGTPGLWGGEIERGDVNPNKTDLYMAGYTCALWETTVSSEFLTVTPVLSASYNGWTGDVLLQLSPTTDPDPASPWERVTLAAGPLCHGVLACSRPVSFLLWDTVSVTGKAGPFAWHKRDLYFLIKRREPVNATQSSQQTTFGQVSRFQRGNATVNRTWIELRQSETCQELFPLRLGKLDLLHCSSLVATVFDSASVADWTDADDIVSGRHLLLVTTAPRRYAFTVLFRVPGVMGNTSTPMAILVEVGMATTADSPKVTVLHQSALFTTSLNASSLRAVAGLGGVDFLENRLCWSTLEKVQCAWWDSESFRDVEEMMNATSVQPHCTNGGGEEAFLSGVAIASTFHPFKPDQNLTIYAGCQSSRNASVGGALLYHMTTRSQSLSAVVSRQGPVNARSMFIAARAEEACPTRATPPEIPGGGGDSEGGGGPGGSGSEPLRWHHHFIFLPLLITNAIYN